MNKLVISEFNSKSFEFNMNQFDSQKIQQKRSMCQTDLRFSLSNIRQKRVKFDLILNKN